VQNIEFTIIADGVDEENALAELIDLVENKLGD
jgi:phosphotransferase system HPr-like phosphotransfer protein